MYKDIFESIRNEAEKRNLRERWSILWWSISIVIHAQFLCQWSQCSKH